MASEHPPKVTAAQLLLPLQNLCQENPTGNPTLWDNQIHGSWVKRGNCITLRYMLLKTNKNNEKGNFF